MSKMNLVDTNDMKVRSFHIASGTFHPTDDGKGTAVVVDRTGFSLRSRGYAKASRYLPFRFLSNRDRKQSATPSTCSESDFDEDSESQVSTIALNTVKSYDDRFQSHTDHTWHHKRGSKGLNILKSHSHSSKAVLAANDDLVDPSNWGFPGYLTFEEYGVLKLFRLEIEKREDSFRSTIFSFGEEEPEPFALCRWLRARKFKIDEVIKMVEEASNVRAGPATHDFYPDAHEALGVDESIYHCQYPQVYCGQAKNGSVLLINKPGVLNMTGLECTTTPTQLQKYQWHVMKHKFGSKLRSLARLDHSFCRFQTLCVIDLEHLSSDSISRKVMDLIQRKSEIDGLCFPETLSKVIVVNAPSYFSLTWKVIKRWLDPRTANKVEIISSRSRWEKRLLELVDAKNLPSDYGGTGESTVDTIAKMGDSIVTRRVNETMSVRHHSSLVVELHEMECMQLDVYTRSTDSTFFSVEALGGRQGRKPIASGVAVKFGGGEEGCLRTTLAKEIFGPGKFRVSANSSRSRVSAAEHFLLIGHIVKR